MRFPGLALSPIAPLDANSPRHSSYARPASSDGYTAGKKPALIESQPANSRIILRNVGYKQVSKKRKALKKSKPLLVSKALRSLPSTKSAIGLHFAGELPDAIHAFEPGMRLTCEELHITIVAGNQLLNTLALVKHDLILQSRDVELIYAIDFSDLYSVMWSNHVPPHSTRQLTRSLIDDATIKFTLPPGTLIELTRHLSRIMVGHQEARERFEEFSRKPVAAALLKFFDQRPDCDGLEGMSGLSSAVESLRGTEQQLNRLFKVLDRPNRIPFEQVVGKDRREFAIDNDILQRCRLSLDLYRPSGKDINNFIDAHNYSCAWAVSKCVSQDALRRCYLLTSSPVPNLVFRSVPWDDEASLLVAPDEPNYSLARHPIQALYLAAMKQGAEKPLPKINEMIQDLQFLLKAWRSIPEYRNFRKNQESATVLVNLPESQKYLKRFMRFRQAYQSTFSNVRRAVESDCISQENFHRQVRVNFSAITTGPYTALSDVAQYSSAHKVFNLFDRINGLALLAIKRVGGESIGIGTSLIDEIDDLRLIAKSSALTTAFDPNDAFDSTTVLCTDQRTGMQVLAGDIYKDYVALWWPTNVSFADFVDAVRRYRIELQPNASMCESPREKEFHGIYVYSKLPEPPNVIALSDNPSLDVDIIMAASAGQMIQMVRIATEEFDACYDFEPFGLLPQRAGLISHHIDKLQASKFVTRTLQGCYSVSRIADVLEELIKKYQSISKSGEVSI